jgi:DNA repair exonuclease SbcCD ATPase subunit
MNESTKIELLQRVNNLENRLNQRMQELETWKNLYSLTNEQYQILKQINEDQIKQLANLKDSINSKEKLLEDLKKDLDQIQKICDSYEKRLIAYQQQIDELTYHYDFYLGGKVDFYNGLNIVVGATFDNKLVCKLHYSIGVEVELNKLNAEAKALIHYKF